MRAFEAFVDDLSNWYIRRSRRRFWDGDEAALRTLWFALVQSLRVIAPVMPFLAEHLWQKLVARPLDGAPESVHLAGWPEAGAPDEALLDEIAEVRRVVELGRQARVDVRAQAAPAAPAARRRGRRRCRAHADEMRDELRVKEVVFGPVEATELRVKPNLPVLGPKLGAGAARRAPGARRRASSRSSPTAASASPATSSEPDEVLVERSAARAGRSRRRTASRSRSRRRSTTSSSSRGARTT